MAATKNCGHPDRPVVKNCLHCGRSLCYECYYDEALGTRVTKRTSFSASGSAGSLVGGGIESEKDFGTFCARCYLDKVNQPGYRLMGDRNDFGQQLTYKAIKPSYLNPFSYSSPIIAILMILLIPVFGLGLLVMAIVYSKPNSLYKEFIEKKARAESQVGNLS